MQRLQNLITGSVGKIETVAVKLKSESLHKFDLHGRHTSNKKAWQSAKPSTQGLFASKHIRKF